MATRSFNCISWSHCFANLDVWRQLMKTVSWCYFSLHSPRYSKISDHNQIITRTSPQILLQGTLLALQTAGRMLLFTEIWRVWHLSEQDGDWIPHYNLSASVPAAVTDSMTAENPHRERYCTVHMAEYRKKTKGNLAKKNVFRRGWGTQQVFTLFWLCSTAQASAMYSQKYQIR